MILELPKKFKCPIAEVVDEQLIIFQLSRFEDLMYELTYALRKKKCIYCGEKLRVKNRTIDHRYPRDSGGVSITNNLYPCCSKCNSKKSNLTHKEFLVFKDMEYKERRTFLKLIKKYRERIFRRIGYVLPNKWVEFIDVNDVKYIKPKYDFKGKRYYKIHDFYNEYHKIPRPIIVDKENHLLDGYNLIIFAKDFKIQYIPAIKLENVILLVQQENED